METFFITTPIYYVNDHPHLGHAYTTVLADTFARFYRRMGVPVRFVTGTDEHGQKIEKAASEQGLKPLELADRVVEQFRALWQLLGITYDDFIRTTEPRHREVVQELWQRMAKKGDLYLGTYSGFYCVGCEAYYSEKELREGTCPVCGKPVEPREEPSYFFRLSRYTQPLLAFYQSHPDFVYPPERQREVEAFVRQGLEDLSVSRRYLRWGIPVPGDPDHVIYVWVDALANYLTVLDPLHPERGLMRFWPPSVHLIGKDILRFHAVYWPAFLMSAGYELPRHIVAHGWWLVEGKKMSKSLRNVVDPRLLVETYGKEALRYFLLREVPLGEDGDFRHSHLIHRLNGDLANDLGNLVSRCHGILRQLGEGRLHRNPPHHPLRERGAKLLPELKERISSFKPHQALELLWQYIGELNRFVDHSQPWRLRKEKKEAELEGVLSLLSLGMYELSLLLDPFLPETARTIRRAFGMEIPEGWTYPAFLPVPEIPGEGILKELSPLFPRLQESRTKEILTLVERAQEEKEGASLPSAPPRTQAPSGRNEEKNLVTLEEFSRIELLVGEIVAAEGVPGSDKLLELKVNLGEGTPRTILAGIARHYEPQRVVGKRVLVVANLKPRKLMGRMSQGMILAGEAEGKLQLLEPPPGLPPGTRIR